MMRTILSLGLLTVAAVALVSGTDAFFGDQELATGNTFAAGEIDLTIDNESYYNGALNEGTSWSLDDLDDNCVALDGVSPCLFFNFLDLKPDDEGEDTISLHVDTNEAWACMEISVRDFDDNECNEPEGVDGDTSCGDDEGELQNEINFVWWADDGDNVLEEDENVFYGPQTIAGLELSIPLADSSGDGLFGSDPLSPDETYYIGKAWCFGTLTLAEVEQDGEGKTGSNGPLDRGTGIACDGTELDNTTQTDSVVGDITFTAHQARGVDDFLCFEDPRPVCEITETYADAVVSSDQGLRANGDPVDPSRSIPGLALGAPQHPLGLDYDNPVVPDSFFSLGFPLEDHVAEIILTFNDNVVVNGPGVDLKLWEVTGGNNYPDELVDVFVGDTPVGPWTMVGDDVTRDAELDLGGISEASYVRIIDASDIGDFEGTADGYDLDAVQALNCVVPDDV